MRTLIVDNDEASRAALKAVLQDLSDCAEALDHESALSLFRESHTTGEPFDLVTLDMGMPQLREEAIIKELRGIEDQLHIDPARRACILVITDLAERQLKTDCIMHGCDDFIEKSVETRLIMDKLAQFGLVTGPPALEVQNTTAASTAQVLDEITRRVKRGDLRLPPAPKIAMKVRQLFTCNAEIAEVIDLLKQDPSISTKLIGVSNSVAYGGVAKNTAVGQAVRRLGVDRTVEVVMSICCRGYFVTNHPAYKKLVEDLWWHSLACAHATEMVVRHQGWKGEEDLFSLGLLHDIGKLILIQVAADLQQPKKSEMDINVEELQSMMAANHRRYGTKVLKIWGYSNAFVSLIDHRRPKDETSFSGTGQVLHQANLLAKAAGFELGIGNADEISADLEQSGYDARLLEELKSRIAERMTQLRYTFG